MTESCSALGDVLAALVDGELDHDGRERAQSHLLRCAACRAEADAQRRHKALLSGLAGPAPAPDLAARLLAIPAPGTHLRPATALATGRPVSVKARPTGAPRPAASPGGSATAGLRGLVHRHRRRAAVGSSLAVLGVGVLLALGGPQGGAVVPVDPAGDGFVVDYVNRTAEVPVTVQPAGHVTADLVP